MNLENSHNIQVNKKDSIVINKGQNNNSKDNNNFNEFVRDNKECNILNIINILI
jgi:hypothetical protein